MRIGIDIDDTITNSHKAVFEEIGKYYNVNSCYLIEAGYTYEDISEDEEKFPNYREFFKKIIEDKLKCVSIKSGAKETIQKLQDEGNEIILITARNYKEFTSPYDLTKQFLDDNNIPYNELHIGIDQKGKFCKENKIDILIDDSIKHCTSALEHNINHLLFDNTFNRGNNELHRVYNWADIYNILNELKKEA